MGRKRVIFTFCVVFLVILELTSVFLMYKSVSVNETKLENVDLKDVSEYNDMFAIMLGDKNGVYTESTSTTWPTDGSYVYNSTKSGCIDANGNKISGALSFDIDKWTVKLSTSSTAHCYLYFDSAGAAGGNLGEYLLLNPTTGLNTTMEGGLYRYQGTTADNYICFGTSDKATCTGNTDAYMYRIVGINSNNQLKLIKKESLNTALKWEGTDWATSGLFSNINGGVFLNNDAYIPLIWKSKIATTTWTYGSNSNINSTALSRYTSEIAAQTNVIAKIGLIYPHDYYYGLNGGKNCSSDGSYSTCKTSWLHLSNNDTEAPSAHEWTIWYYGAEDNGYGINLYKAYSIESPGYVYRSTNSNAISVRPVFYLNADEIYVSGSGTQDDPIILKEPNSNPISEYLMSSPTTGLTTSNEEGGLYRYQGTTADNYICFGTSDKATCTGNTDAYMYRIMGINSNNQLKLIKKEALNEAMAWHTYSTTNTIWPDSSIYSSINGNAFLTNATYVPSGWSDKIATVTWKYGDNTSSNLTAYDLYYVENSWQKKINAKIGLMYMHDYYYGMSGGNNCSKSGAYGTCNTSWLSLSNNDTGAPNTSYELTMSRYGQYSSGNYYAWRVTSSGYVTNVDLTSSYSVRPVFYLASDVSIVGGSGTLSDPFIIG